MQNFEKNLLELEFLELSRTDLHIKQLENQLVTNHNK
jgi:hypothetical protein